MQKYAVYMKDMQKSIYYIYCIICTPRFAEFVMSLTRCRNWRSQPASELNGSRNLDSDGPDGPLSRVAGGPGSGYEPERPGPSHPGGAAAGAPWRWQAA